MGEPPLLLVGCERSGSTLLRLMLDSHPDVSFVEEFEYALELIRDNRLPTTAEFTELAEERSDTRVRGPEPPVVA